MSPNTKAYLFAGLLVTAVAGLSFLSGVSPLIGQSASTWIPTNRMLKPFDNNYGLLVPGLATSTTGCLGVAANGYISASGSACGSGGGAGFGKSWEVTGNYLAPTTTIGIIVSASSTITSLTAINATTTNATTTNLRVSGALNLFGTIGTTLADFCTAITGGAGLCDGTDATSAGGSGALATSSSETKGQLPYWTSTNGTPATLGSVATATLSCSSGISCTSTAVIGTASTITLDATGAWTGTFDGLQGSDYLANSFSTTSANYWSSLGLGFSTTSADAWKNLRNFFSTTSASYFTSLGLSWSTTSADHWETLQTARTADDLTNNQIDDLSDVTALSETTGDVLYWNGSAWADIATSSLGLTFSTTSANYWETQQTARTADDLTNNSIEDLNDVAVITENLGDLFYWNGTAWSDIATSTLYGSATPGYVLGWNGTSWGPMATATCVQITGSADLCDGSDASGGGASFGESWGIVSGSYLAPTSTWPILVNAGTSTITNLTTVNATASNATTSRLWITSLTSCTEALETNALGQVVCGTDATAAGAADPFTWATTFNRISAATTSNLWIRGNSLFASSSVYVDTHKISTSSANYLDFQNQSSDPYTLLRIKAPNANPDEATLALLIDVDGNDDGTNEEFVDIYNEKYFDSWQVGFRQGYSGTGIAKPIAFGHWDVALGGAGKDPGNKLLLMPNGTVGITQSTTSLTTGAMLHIASSTATELFRIDRAPGTNKFLVLGGTGDTTVTSNFVVAAGNSQILRNGSNNADAFMYNSGSSGNSVFNVSNFTSTLPINLDGYVTMVQASTTRLSVFNEAKFGATATSSFSSAGILTLTNLNGPLDARNGVVGATTSIGVLYGGTGLTSAPSNGQLLIGNSSGGYTLSATSTLGLNVSALRFDGLNGPLDVRNGVVGATSTVTVRYGGTGLTALGASSTVLTTNGTIAIWQSINSFVELIVSQITSIVLATNSIWDFRNAYVKDTAFFSVTYATSTAWTGTTTIDLGPAPRPQTFKNVKCFTDTGTVQASFRDDTSNRMTFINASTTVGTTTIATNASYTNSEKRYVDLGTPASSPTRVSCSITYTLD